MRRPDELHTVSDRARVLWAKTDDGEDWHPLLAHMLDTAAVAHEVLLREPVSTHELYTRDLGLAPELALGCVCALAGLHDLGKASPAFQAKWGPGAERVRAHGLTWTHPPQDIPHGIISQWALDQFLVDDLGWHVPTAQHAADAIGCHHGFRATGDELDVGRGERGDRSWDDVRHELVTIVLKTLRVSSLPPSVGRFSGEAFMRLAGLTSFADWIASNLPFVALGDDPAAYYAGALDRGRAALDGIGWYSRQPLSSAPGSFEATFAYLGTSERPFRARPLQSIVERLLGDVTAPTLLLIEGPMGEGKTEAALYAHLHLQAALGHRGLYIALPTQATGNAMFTRAVQFLTAVGSGRNLDLELLIEAFIVRIIIRWVQPCDGVAQAEGILCMDVVPAIRQPGIRLRVSTIESHPSAQVGMRADELICGEWPPWLRKREERRRFSKTNYLHGPTPAVDLPDKPQSP